MIKKYYPMVNYKYILAMSHFMTIFYKSIRYRTINVKLKHMRYHFPTTYFFINTVNITS